MSRVTRADVERIAELAAMKVDEGQLELVTKQLDRILEYVSRLETSLQATEDAELRLEPPPGATHVQPLRDDDVRPVSPAVNPREFAPDFKDGLFLVPRLPALDRDDE
jgi:aspartyl/glutamyl-tRNA(Asn/Gln) amidotransferase C subunit